MNCKIILLILFVKLICNMYYTRFFSFHTRLFLSYNFFIIHYTWNKYPFLKKILFYFKSRFFSLLKTILFIHSWMKERMNEQDGLVHSCMKEWKMNKTVLFFHSWMNGWMNKTVLFILSFFHEWKNEWMNEWMKKMVFNNEKNLDLK